MVNQCLKYLKSFRFMHKALPTDACTKYIIYIYLIDDKF